MTGTGNHHIKQNKVDSERQVSCFLPHVQYRGKKRHEIEWELLENRSRIRGRDTIEGNENDCYLYENVYKIVYLKMTQ
jgi:hypothetical protein